MHLSRFSDISLRALMYLGAHRQRIVSTKEMAHSLAVSRQHLLKCLQRLSALDLVEGIRGRGGGYRLSGRGSAIRLGALVRSTEPSLAMAECFEPDSTCPLTGNCSLAGVLSEAQGAFFSALDEYTLADLLEADAPHLVRLGGVGHG